jgi:hypothetical protein
MLQLIPQLGGLDGITQITTHFGHKDLNSHVGCHNLEEIHCSLRRKINLFECNFADARATVTKSVNQRSGRHQAHHKLHGQ